MANSDRRRFLKLLAAVVGSAAAAVTSLPVLGAILTPLLKKKDDDGSVLHALAEKDLAVGVPRRVELVATVIDTWTRSVGVVGAAWLLKTPDGKITALSTICPHSGCSIGQQSKNTYSCPCHKSLFALDGTPQEGPSPRPMDPLPVELKDGAVWVKWLRYKVGVKEQKIL